MPEAHHPSALWKRADARQATRTSATRPESCPVVHNPVHVDDLHDHPQLDELGISPNMRMSRFSVSYVTAIAAAAACDWTEPHVDEDGVDLTLSRPGPHRYCHSPSLALQLKATTRWRATEEAITYDLKVGNYEQLIEVERLVPAILAVLPVPNDQSEWITYSPENIALYHRAYWIDLVGQAPTDNTETIAVRIPKSQALDAQGLVELMHRVARDGRLTL